MATSRLLYRRNPLAYPVGAAPGFDPLHPAAGDISGGEGISVVAINGNFVDLTTGRIGAKTGVPTWGIASGTGPGFRGIGGDYIDFTGKLATTPPATTLAAIAQFDATNDGSFHWLVCADTASFNGLLRVYVDGQVSLYNGNDILSGIVLAANTPYFIAVSAGTSGNFNFVVMDLRTGKVLTAVVSATAPGATNGTYRIGHGTGTNASSIAAAMYAPSFLSMSQLVQWAQSPWEFWYPRQTEMLVAAAAATQYAAFSIPPRDGAVYTQMIGY